MDVGLPRLFLAQTVCPQLVVSMLLVIVLVSVCVVFTLCGFEGRSLVLIVLVLGHCIYFFPI